MTKETEVICNGCQPWKTTNRYKVGDWVLCPTTNKQCKVVEVAEGVLVDRPPEKPKRDSWADLFIRSFLAVAAVIAIVAIIGWLITIPEKLSIWHSDLLAQFSAFRVWLSDLLARLSAPLVWLSDLLAWFSHVLTGVFSAFLFLLIVVSIILMFFVALALFWFVLRKLGGDLLTHRSADERIRDAVDDYTKWIQNNPNAETRERLQKGKSLLDTYQTASGLPDGSNYAAIASDVLIVSQKKIRRRDGGIALLLTALIVGYLLCMLQVRSIDAFGAFVQQMFTTGLFNFLAFGAILLLALWTLPSGEVDDYASLSIQFLLLGCYVAGSSAVTTIAIQGFSDSARTMMEKVAVELAWNLLFAVIVSYYGRNVGVIVKSLASILGGMQA